MQLRLVPFKRIAGVLVDPAASIRCTLDDPDFGGLAVAFFSLTLALGAAALPGQLSVLTHSLAPVGQVALDSHREAMYEGLARVIVADRLVMSPTLLLCGILVVLASDPILALPEDGRDRLWAVVVLGFAPLLIQEVGELALTYLAVPAEPTPGQAVNLPSRFVTGPLLLWGGEGTAPAWMEVVNSRVNLVSLWCVALWAVGLRSLDGGRLRSWHMALPLACLAIAGVVTWIATPIFVSALLGRP
jgi:hypothetical protein